jgi:hypothetical protein
MRSTWWSSEYRAAGVIVGEPLDVMVERVDAGRGDDARLPHRAAEEVLAAPRLRHQLVRAGDQRAQRTAQPFREAERDRVERTADARGRDTARDRCVDQARAVEVHRKVVLAAGRDDRVDLLERPDAAAGAVMRVLDGDEPRRCDVHARAVADLRDDLVGREASVRPLEPDRQEP